MKPLKDIPTPKNALLSNSVLDEIMLDRNLKSYGTDLIENPKGLFSEVLGIQFNIEKIPEIDVIYEYARQTDVDIDILRSKLGCIILPHFLLIQGIKSRNAKLAENAISELSNNILKLLKSERLIFENGSDYLIERLRLENPLPSSPYNAKKRIYNVSLFKAFIVNLIEIAEKEKKKDKEELEAKEIKFSKTQEDLISSEKMKNFKETGIKETDYERDQRELVEKEIEKNFKETGIKETDDDREQREYEEEIQKEEELEEEMIEKFGPIAESLVEDYKSGLIDKNKLAAQLNEMKSKGMLYEEYIFDLLDSIEED